MLNDDDDDDDDDDDHDESESKDGACLRRTWIDSPLASSWAERYRRHERVPPGRSVDKQVEEQRHIVIKRTRTRFTPLCSVPLLH